MSILMHVSFCLHNIRNSITVEIRPLLSQPFTNNHFRFHINMYAVFDLPKYWCGSPNCIPACFVWGLILCIRVLWSVAVDSTNSFHSSWNPSWCEKMISQMSVFLLFHQTWGSGKGCSWMVANVRATISNATVFKFAPRCDKCISVLGDCVEK